MPKVDRLLCWKEVYLGGTWYVADLPYVGKEDMMIKYIYSVFLGLLLAIFVGVGISVFYPQPEQPQCLIDLDYSYASEKEPTAETIAVEKACRVEQQAWDEEMKPYNRNVSIIALISAVVLVTIGLALGDRIKILADGMMIGGVFTLLYSLIRGFMSSNTKYSFLMVTVSLIVVMALGYFKLNKPHDKAIPEEI